MELSKEQHRARTMVIENRISILTGGPGTGKTTTIKAIIADAQEMGLIIIQAAPTGKAAKRMAEATGMFASTIHSMLGCEYDMEKDKFIFLSNEKNPLCCDLLIMDEISMITNSLMFSVMQAVNPERTKVLLIGDQDQLPSVGAGAVLRDLLASKIIPHIELTKIFRSGGTIVQACHNIKQKFSYKPDKKIDLDADMPANLIHIECENAMDAVSGIKKLVAERLPMRGFDPLDDIQVISPVNEKGPLSCKYLNFILREALNPQAEESVLDKLVFYKGDKIINTKNSQVKKTDNTDTAIVNGDIGIVKTVEDKRLVVMFSDPARAVYLPKKNNNLLHAYCVTCHKFQGSEAPVIIVPVHKQFNYFMSNAWIYTALSRGKSLVITVGNFSTIERAIQNKKSNDRKTMLFKDFYPTTRLNTKASANPTKPPIPVQTATAV